MILLAASSLTFDGFENNDFLRTFNLASKAGYKRIEFNCWYADTLTPQKMMDLKRRCENAGLQPISVHVSPFGGNDSRDIALNTAHKIRAIEAVKELGCRRVVAPSMSRDGLGSLDNIIKELEILVPIAEREDVLICLENHCSSILAGRDDYQYILDRITSDHVGICLDSGHLEAQGEEILEFIDRFFSRIIHVHLKENNGFGVKRFSKFGEGTTDNKGMIEKLHRLGYSGYMSVEISPEIGETGDDINFTMDDLSKPIQMFSKFEKNE